MGIERADQVWSTDITYVPLASGFVYLAAVIDWFSRYVQAWRLSNTLDSSFRLDMLEEALSGGRPEVFNTDQGVQLTASAWTGRLESAGVQVSMDGRGHSLNNVFGERLWRSVKYEEVYLHRYEAVPQLANGLERYFAYDNERRRKRRNAIFARPRVGRSWQMAWPRTGRFSKATFATLNRLWIVCMWYLKPSRRPGR